MYKRTRWKSTLVLEFKYFFEIKSSTLNSKNNFQFNLRAIRYLCYELRYLWTCVNFSRSTSRNNSLVMPVSHRQPHLILCIKRNAYSRKLEKIVSIFFRRNIKSIFSFSRFWTPSFTIFSPKSFVYKRTRWTSKLVLEVKYFSKLKSSTLNRKNNFQFNPRAFSRPLYLRTCVNFSSSTWTHNSPFSTYSNVPRNWKKFQARIQSYPYS